MVGVPIPRVAAWCKRGPPALPTSPRAGAEASELGVRLRAIGLSALAPRTLSRSTVDDPVRLVQNAEALETRRGSLEGFDG